MPRKFSCLFLALSVFISTVSIAYADEKAAPHLTAADYQQVAMMLEDIGMSSGFDASRESAQAVFDDALLTETEGMSISQLQQLALRNRQQQAQAQQTSRQELADTLAQLEAGGGVKLTEDARVYSDAGVTASIEIIPAGKVVSFVRVDVNPDWYVIAFDNYIGYIPAASCTPVKYADYADTDAVLTDEEIAAKNGAASTSSSSAVAYGSAVVSGGSSLRSSVVDYAYSFIGVPYSYGGASRSGTDCSGLTMQIFDAFGISLTHGASGQYAQSSAVSGEDLQPGDLVFFHCGYSGIGHVGLYVGDGCFIHAADSGVQVASLYSGYWSSNYYGAGRIISD